MMPLVLESVVVCLLVIRADGSSPVVIMKAILDHVIDAQR